MQPHNFGVLERLVWKMWAVDNLLASCAKFAPPHDLHKKLPRSGRALVLISLLSLLRVLRMANPSAGISVWPNYLCFSRLKEKAEWEWLSQRTSLSNAVLIILKIVNTELIQSMFSLVGDFNFERVWTEVTGGNYWITERKVTMEKDMFLMRKRYMEGCSRAPEHPV